MENAEHPSSFEELLGSDLLVGLTYVDASDTVVEMIQKHGQVIAADERQGVVIDCGDGETYAIPPQLNAIWRAKPGHYHLRATGKIVVDPDYTATFQVSRES